MHENQRFFSIGVGFAPPNPQPPTYTRFITHCELATVAPMLATVKLDMSKHSRRYRLTVLTYYVGICMHILTNSIPVLKIRRFSSISASRRT